MDRLGPLDLQLPLEGQAYQVRQVLQGLQENLSEVCMDLEGLAILKSLVLLLPL